MLSRFAAFVLACAILGGFVSSCSGRKDSPPNQDGTNVPSAVSDAAAKIGEQPPAAQPIDEFTTALSELGAETPPPSETPAPTPSVSVSPADVDRGPSNVDNNLSNVDTAALTEEVKALRIEMAELGRTLDVYLDTVITDLKDENARLRQEVARLYEMGGAAAFQPGLPRPGQMFIEQIVSETPRDSELDATLYDGLVDAPPDAAAALPQDAAFDGKPYAIVREWGRSPQDVAALGQDVPSLKGMICAAPEGLSDQDLIALGQQLRSEAEGYDNINIEVLAGIEAAQYYAENNKARGGTRVLSVSKHAATGRDVILLMTGGMTREISPP